MPTFYGGGNAAAPANSVGKTRKNIQPYAPGWGNAQHFGSEKFVPPNIFEYFKFLPECASGDLYLGGFMWGF